MGPDYRDVHGRFPLPATFVREVSDEIAQSGNSYTTRLISPWPINKEQGPRDEFERDGFASLMRDPGTPFVRTDTVQGQAVMRVLLADLASAQSCVACHNAHPASPKRDFHLNGLMGGLEVVIPMDRYVAESQRDLVLTVGGGLGLCLLVFGIVSVSTRWIVSRPLVELSQRMITFGTERQLGNVPAQPRRVQSSGDEVANLRQSFSEMASVIVSQQTALQDANALLEQRVEQRTEELRRTMAEKERLGSELRIASDIQKSILPRTFPPFPDRNDFEIYAETIPALEMGGDLYDFFLIDRERLGIVIADVSGKGVPAAIFMAVSRSLIKATALKDVGVSACLEHVNHLLCPDNESAMFVTVFYGILNTRTGWFEYSSAGHNVPYLLHDHQLVSLDSSKGVALGIVEDAPYITSGIAMLPGDTLFLYTDGVTEAMDARGHMFSSPRLEDILHQHAGLSARDLVRTVITEVNQYAGNVVQADDITMLVLRYGRRPALMMTSASLTVTLQNRLPELGRLAQAVDQFADEHDMAVPHLRALNLALEELITNAIAYGYDDDAEHHIVVRLSVVNDHVHAEIEDDGKPFNPLEVASPDLTSPIEERPVGGLGIHLVRSMMDEVAYRRQAGKNYVTLMKRVR